MKRTISIILAAVMLLSFVACGKHADPWQEQYDLGIRCLSECNYEEAIIAFTAAIEIDPKNPNAYIGLANLYVDCAEIDKAYATLDRGYSETSNNEILQLLEELSSLMADDLSGVSDISTNEYGAEQFEQRRWYVDPDTLSSEQRSFLDSVIDAVKDENRVSLEALAARYSDLFPVQIYTKTEDYKIFMETWRFGDGRKESASDLRVELRPCSGTGYYAMVCPFNGFDISDTSENVFYYVYGYATCECVNWQPQGTFIQKAEEWNITGDIKLTTHTGTADAGGIVGEEICQDGDYTHTEVYEGGHLVLSDGLTDSVWGPLNLPNGTASSAERIWW